VSGLAAQFAPAIHSIRWNPNGVGLQFQFRGYTYVTREPYPEIVFPGDEVAPLWCAAELIRNQLSPIAKEVAP
jgi:hypothetical protein